MRPLPRSLLMPALAATTITLVACSDAFTSPAGEVVSVCHTTGATSALLDVPTAALAGHRGHGDYVARLLVDPKSATVSNDSIHFTRVGDALAWARAIRLARNEGLTASCRITIAVAAGVLKGSSKASADPAFERLPLVIDVPDITLHGSYAMLLDENGRPSPASAAAVSNGTVIAATPGLVSIKTGSVLDKYAEPLIVVNGHPDGPRGDGAIIEGFILRSGNEAADAVVGGNAVWAMRAQRLVVSGNQIEAGFSEPVELRASTGRVEANLLTGRGGSCALCMFGPGDYQVIANKQTGLTGRLGVLVFPTISAAVPPGVEPLTLGASALVTVAVTNNELRDHQEVPFGIGLRVAGIGPGAPDVAGTARVTAQYNDLSNNRFGIVAETGFPVNGTGLHGDIELTLRGNTLLASCQTPLLVSLVSQPTTVGLQSAPSSRNSSYAVTLNGNVSWADAWFSHPAGAGNSLTVDGASIANGARVLYDGARSCATP